jgi:Ras homolog enriched in brain
MVDLQIRDTGGLGEEDVFRPELALSFHGYVLVFALTSARSLEVAQGLYARLISLTGAGAAAVPCVLVGNKCDAEPAAREVTADAARAVADGWKAPYIEVSAKTGEGISTHTHDHSYTLLHLCSLCSAFDHAPFVQLTDHMDCVCLSLCVSAHFG